MSGNYLDNDKAVTALNKHLESCKLKKYSYPNLGRDALVNYCLRNKIEFSSEKYPSPRVSPNFDEYMSNSQYGGARSEDYEEFHNYKFIQAFSESLAKLGYKSLNIYYECFEEKPYARCYEIDMAEINTFLENSEVPVYFLDDTLLFSPDFRYGMCIFHHELIEFFSFGGRASEIHQSTLAKLGT